MRDELLSLVSEWLHKDRQIRTDYEARLVAYEEVALRDLYFRISDHPFEDPQDILYAFMTEMSISSFAPELDDSDPNPFRVAVTIGETIAAMMEYPIE